MIQRALHSKNFIACLLTLGTGTILFFEMPFPEDNLILQLIALRAPEVFAGLKYSYTNLVKFIILLHKGAYDYVSRT